MRRYSKFFLTVLLFALSCSSPILGDPQLVIDDSCAVVGDSYVATYWPLGGTRYAEAGYSVAQITKLIQESKPRHFDTVYVVAGVANISHILKSQTWKPEDVVGSTALGATKEEIINDLLPAIESTLTPGKIIVLDPTEMINLLIAGEHITPDGYHLLPPAYTNLLQTKPLYSSAL